jgi:hypothetical protein
MRIQNAELASKLQTSEEDARIASLERELADLTNKCSALEQDCATKEVSETYK